MKNGLKQLIFFFLIVSIMSCANIFAGGAKKDDDASKFVDAKIKINKRDWTGAIDAILSMTPESQARREVKFLLASSYAGRCGLDFLALAQHLSNTGGSSNLFQMLLPVFEGGTTAQRDDCILAESAINSISTNPAARTDDENTLAAFIGLSKTTVAISITMDTNGDGVADATDPCTIPDADADQMVTGMTLAYNSLQQVGGSIGQTFITLMGVMCTSLAGSFGGVYDFCSVTDIGSVTQDHRRGARGMAKETLNGFGLKIGGGDAATEADNGGTGCGT